MENKISDTLWSREDPAGIYLLKVNNTNARTSCEINSNLTIKTLERSNAIGVVLVSLLLTEHISHLVLVFL